MYGVRAVSELNIPQLWAAHAPHQSLAVPLGLRGKDDKVYLDLHEKAHGPHGLVAGTTGAGKSEIIQSYILSLAINFHPHDVAFLLIDYKGGGMANLFKDLPHLLGAITNLDAAASMRALASINAELKRRQRLFSRYEVNHINQYQKLYKSGEADEPMPHLFLISDEFAELKSNEPEFMKELVSTSRIGRSLGIHLILATQKPTGVVDDQIWSNSRFKLALKVATTQDSQEMLKTPDAADITQSGRAYLQVGHNEIYELFQSAYSGADYQPDKDALNIEDHTIYSINANGQYDILTQDLSGLDAAEQITQIPTELEVIVDAIRAETDKAQIPALPRPWLPPLAERIYLEDINAINWQETWSSGYKPLTLTLGVADLPHQQAQVPVTINLTDDGNIALFGSPGTGKSTFLQTVFVNLARQFTPEQVHFYLFDFGANGLAPLRSYPHVADMFLVDEGDKILKWVRRIKETIAKRKKLLQEHAVANIYNYTNLTNESVPAIIILLDSFESFKTEAYYTELEMILTQIAREGMAIGIYLVFSTDRIGSVRSPLLSSLKNKLALYLNESDDVRGTVGRLTIPIEEIKGRGAIRLDEPSIIQYAYPTVAKDDIQNIENTIQEANAMAKYWKGETPEPIPIIPEQITSQMLSEMPTIIKDIDNGAIPLGIDLEYVESTSININEFKHLLLLTDNEESLLNMVDNFIEISQLASENIRVLFVDILNRFEHYHNKVKTHLSNADEISQILGQIRLEMSRRKEARNFEHWFIVIPNIEQLLSEVNLDSDQFISIYEDSHKLGIHFIIGGYYPYINTNISPIAKYLKANSKSALIGMRLVDQTIYNRVYNSKELYLLVDEAYLHHKNKSVKIKMIRN